MTIKIIMVTIIVEGGCYTTSLLLATHEMISYEVW